MDVTTLHQRVLSELRDHEVRQAAHPERKRSELKAGFVRAVDVLELLKENQRLHDRLTARQNDGGICNG